jgi:hypothetical protein
MNANDYLGGERLRLEDVQRPILVTVSEVTEMSFDDAPGKKLVLHFEEHERSLVLNKTNTRLAMEIFQSAETEDWIGRQIVVYLDPSVSFQGRQTGGLRVRARAPSATHAPPSTTEMPPEGIPF